MLNSHLDQSFGRLDCPPVYLDLSGQAVLLYIVVDCLFWHVNSEVLPFVKYIEITIQSVWPSSIFILMLQTIVQLSRPSVFVNLYTGCLVVSLFRLQYARLSKYENFHMFWVKKAGTSDMVIIWSTRSITVKSGVNLIMAMYWNGKVNSL